MKRLGLTADVVSAPGDYTTTNYFEEAGAAVARTLLERAELPTAVVASNDQAAAGFLQLMGTAAVDAALRRVKSPATPPQETVVPTSLIVRSSTAAPRVAATSPSR